MGKDSMMYYALTLRGDIITGVHSSTNPFTQDQFKRNPKLANDTVVPFEYGEYKAGHDLREYMDGKLRPLVDRISDGLASIPNGHEMIDGQLVNLAAPIENQPQSIRQRIEDAYARIAALEDEIAIMRSSISVWSRDIASEKSTRRTI